MAGAREKNAERRRKHCTCCKEKQARQATEDQQRDLDEEAQFQKELDEQNKQLEREVRKARLEADLAKKKAEIEKLKNGAQAQVPASLMNGGTGGVRTYQLFGILNGMNVPLAQVVVCDRATGRCSVVPGGRVLVGEQPAEGFGLAGVPGRWAMYYGGRSPAEFGLDADKGVHSSDGSRGWVRNAQFLSQVFGSNWRAPVYY